MNVGASEQHATDSLRLQAHMLDHIGQAVIATDLTGKIIYANPAAYTLYRWPENELAGRNVFETVPAEGTAEKAQEVMDKLRGGESWNGEFLVRRHDGTVFTALLNNSPVYDHHRNFIGFIGISSDISALKAAQDRAARQEAMLESAAHLAGLGTWEYDIVNDKLEWSNETLRIFGITREQFNSKDFNFVNFVHPEDREMVGAINERARKEGGSIVLHYRIIRPDGEIRYIESRGNSLYDEHGKPIRRAGLSMDVTDRKMAEAGLRESEERLRQLADNVNAVFWIIDYPSGNVLYINPAYEKIWGKSCRSVLEQRESWLDPVHPEDVDRLRAAQALLPTGDYDETYRIIRPDGQFRWIRDRAFPVRDATGKIYRIVGTAVDITERKRSEHCWTVLSRLGRALNSASSAREAGNIIAEAADELFGWDAATLDLYDEETDIVASIITIDTINGKRTSCKPATHWVRPSPRARNVLKDGAQLILRKAEEGPDVKAHMFGDTGRPSRSLMLVPMRQGSNTVGILSVQSYRANAYTSQDLELFQMFADYGAAAMNRIAAEEERHRTEQRLIEQAALLDIAHDAILVKDLEDRIIYWNKGAERSYGWTSLEAIGSKASILNKDNAKYCEAMDSVMKHGEWIGEMTNQSKDGRELIMSVRWTLVRDKEQNPKAILAINTDITDKKKLEAQILRGQRLESIGTLAGGIAHDLNNVLAPILMSVQMLRGMVKGSEGQQILDTLQTSSQRGADLIKQVLSFARGVEGKRGPVNVRHLAKDIEKVVHDTFPKNLRFIIDSPRDLWTIEGDPTHIHQVLMNLCVNARDAMPDGGKLTVTLKNMVVDPAYARMNPDGKAGPHVVIAVEDTGMGIPAGIRDKIFDPFFTTKEVGKGTGLGLATVLTIVKSHHGFINVYSEPGKGAQFKIYLPASPNQVVVEQVVQEQNQLPRGNGELVMVVDDEDAIRSITEQTLECFGYRTLSACNGAEAVALFAQQPDEIAAVLTDMMMPVMDGPAAIVALRAIKPNVKIIGSSGLGAHDGPARSISAGVHEFISKPYTAERLLKALDKVLRHSD
jgi:PAS domain S-box-containing protein